MLDISREKGIGLNDQRFDWRDLVKSPTSKLDDDAMTRVRIILMNGVESNAIRTQHAFARMNQDLRLALAQVRRVEQHQQTMVNWLLPADLSPLETTIAFEQVAIEVTASIAQHEPNDYMAQVYRFGLLEDFDHMYRFSALMDRADGMDSNSILQNYTDIMPGRPTAVEHRAPEDDLREHYDRTKAAPLTKLHALTLTAGEQQTHDYYMTIGPMFADPLARQLYAEIASIEEQHVTQYESMLDPDETLLEKWLLHEVAEIYNYYSCLQYETNPRIKAIWERFVNYEIGHFHFVKDLFQKIEKRDVAEIVPLSLPEPIEYRKHREFVRSVLEAEVNLRAKGTQFIQKSEEDEDSPSVIYRTQMNSQGSPSEAVAEGYCWKPGTELSELDPFTGAESDQEEVA
jgi:rubrerythrin